MRSTLEEQRRSGAQALQAIYEMGLCVFMRSKSGKILLQRGRPRFGQPHRTIVVDPTGKDRSAHGPTPVTQNTVPSMPARFDFLTPLHPSSLHRTSTECSVNPHHDMDGGTLRSGQEVVRLFLPDEARPAADTAEQTIVWTTSRGR